MTDVDEVEKILSSFKSAIDAMTKLGERDLSLRPFTPFEREKFQNLSRLCRSMGAMFEELGKGDN